jgi:signal peptidase I
VPALRAEGRLQSGARRALRALWYGIIPALLAGLVLRYLVPPVGTGVAGAVAALGNRFGLYLGVSLFFLFAGLLRYWRFHLPGGRYASNLPVHWAAGETDGDRLAECERHAQIYEMLRSRAVRRRLERELTPEQMTELDGQLAKLKDQLEGCDLDGARQARRHVESVATRVLVRRQRLDAFILVATVPTMAVVALAIRAYLVAPYLVLSTSMLPTLEPGDRILARRLRFERTPENAPHRGDVLVFRTSSVALGPVSVALPDVLVKRVIGLPGDRVAMRGSVPVINGWEVPSCDAGDYMYVMPDASGDAIRGRLFVEFLEDRAYLTVHSLQQFPEPYLVKAGEVFVVGDDRSNSLDSRAYNAGRGGGVPFAGIEARAQWFLTGSHRSGDLDLGRLLHPIDGLQGRLRLEGLDTRQLEEGITRCLAIPPTNTRPPPPSG